MTKFTFQARLSGFLNEPHYADFSFRTALRTGLGFAVFVFLLLWLLQPFGFQQLPNRQLLVICLLIALATVIVVTGGMWLLPKLISKADPEDHWTIGKELLLTLMITSTMAIMIGLLLHLTGIISGPLIANLGMVIFKTLLVSLPPILFFAAIDRNKLLKKHLRRAEQTNRELARRSLAQAKEELVVLEDEKGRPVLQLPADRLLYLQSAGNYAEVYFLDDQLTPKREILRNRLKRLAELLPDKQFLQCHRSYLVNQNRIRQVRGNARNYELLLEGTELSVPVARNKAEDVLAALERD